MVSYAIADVATFVRAASATDAESQRRGETLHFPDARVLLHPHVLSEGAASLLPGEVRSAVLWQIALDPTGTPAEVDVRRARVRSRQQLDYAGLQQMVDAGSASPDAVAVLPKVGVLCQQLARQRHAVNLDLPEQVVEGEHSTAGH